MVALVALVCVVVWQGDDTRAKLGANGQVVKRLEALVSELQEKGRLPNATFAHEHNSECKVVFVRHSFFYFFCCIFVNTVYIFFFLS